MDDIKKETTVIEWSKLNNLAKHFRYLLIVFF